MTNTTPRRGHKLRRALALGLSCLAAAPASALDLTLPGRPVQTHAEDSASGSAAIPLGPYADGAVPVEEVTGAVNRRAWRIDASGLTTLQLLNPIREQLEADGYEVLFTCQSRSCGGFEFRFGVEVRPAPEMYVDLFDYRALTARRSSGGDVSHVFALVSRSAGAGYLQVVQVSDGAAQADLSASGSTLAAPAETGSLADRLQRLGHATLRDLEFAVGAATLADSRYASLEDLAAFLLEDAGRRIVLVGHTDSLGSLDGNIALSRRRAQAVAARLQDRYGVPAAQVSADGVGYLAPLLSNLTEEGREANRRVEAVLLNTN